MLNQALYSQLLSAFDSSPEFVELTIEQQSDLKKKYLNANDEQLLKALELLNKHAQNLVDQQKKLDEEEAKISKLAHEILTIVGELEKIEAKNKENSSKSEDEKLLSELDKNLL